MIESNKISSDNQKGGITANTVYISDINNIKGGSVKKVSWYKKVKIIIWVLATAVTSIIALINFFKPTSEDKMKDNIIFNVNSNYQQGGITAGVVNIAEKPLPKISVDFINDVKSANPDKKQVVVIPIIQDSRTIKMAHLLEEEFKNNNIPTTPFVGTALGIPAFEGVQYQDEGDRIAIMVGMIN